MARQWRALAGAGGATAVLTAADLAKPWPLALIVDRLLAERTQPFELSGADVRLLVAVAGMVLVIALAEAFAQYATDLWLQSAGRADRARPARARLRAPAAPLARLPPATPEG